MGLPVGSQIDTPDIQTKTEKRPKTIFMDVRPHQSNSDRQPNRESSMVKRDSKQSKQGSKELLERPQQIPGRRSGGWKKNKFWKVQRREGRETSCQKSPKRDLRVLRMSLRASR